MYYRYNTSNFDYFYDCSMYGTEKMEVKKITELKKAQTEHFF